MKNVTTKNDGNGFKDIFFKGVLIATVNLEKGYIGVSKDLKESEDNSTSISYN